MTRFIALLIAFALCCHPALATVSTTHFENSHTGNGATTAFAFTFKSLNKDHVKVYVNDVLQSSGYTVALVPSGVGGTVTFSVAPATDADIDIKRETPKTQATAFPLGGKLSTADLENGLDRLTMILQEVGAGITGPQGPTGATGPSGQDGEMAGPASSTDGAIALFDGTSGATLKDGPTPAVEGNILKVVSGVWASASAAATIPSGVVAIWPFDSAVVAIPTGWEPMDGRSVTINGVSRTTPDTRGKYLLCASEDDTGSSGFTGATVRPGQVAGVKTHQHAQGGTCSIGLTTVTGTVTTATAQTNVTPGSNFALHSTYNITTNAHNHTATLSGSVAANTEASRPVEIGLTLIIKVD